MRRTDVQTVRVPEQAAGDPDLPEHVAGRPVHVETGPGPQRVGGRLPRGVQDLAGRVLSARWEGDTQLECRIGWGDAAWVDALGILLHDGAVELVWDGHGVLAVPLPSRALSREQP